MKKLIEECFYINTKIIKKDLQEQSHAGGFINITQGKVKSIAEYEIEYEKEYNYMVIRYEEVEQRIRLAESELTYGARNWFVCDCDMPVDKLYLPKGENLFKCRICHHLKYELTTFNKKSIHGSLMYKTNRIIKAMKVRESTRSVFYGGKFTSRFERFLNISDRLGLGYIREEAEGLLLAVNNQ